MTITFFIIGLLFYTTFSSAILHLYALFILPHAKVYIFLKMKK